MGPTDLTLMMMMMTLEVSCCLPYGVCVSVCSVCTTPTPPSLACPPSCLLTRPPACLPACFVSVSVVSPQLNLRQLDAKTVTFSLDETTKLEDVDVLFKVLNGGKPAPFTAASLAPAAKASLGAFERKSPFMQQPVFNSYHNEHDMLR